MQKLINPLFHPTKRIRVKIAVDSIIVVDVEHL
jgi:hypothetical protein